MLVMSDAQRFLHQIESLDYAEMLLVSDEIGRARRTRLKFEDLPRYLEFLQGVRWFLQTGTKPSNYTDADFRHLKPLAERLIQKHQMKPTLLDAFAPSGS